MRVNYKSDFDFVLSIKGCNGDDIGFPTFDFEAKFFTPSHLREYVVSCIGGVCTNCFNDENKIHCVFNDHHLGVGKLHVDFRAFLPNAIYADGIRDTYTPQETDIELVKEAGDCHSEFNVEVVAPFVYITAYDMAVRNGYAGTLDEYIEYINKFPMVLEVNDAVHDILSDIDSGKKHIADAITKQGVPTTSIESMENMAKKVLGLHLAVPGDNSMIYHERKLGLFDLYTEMYNNQMAEYPYMYAISFMRKTVTLSGADAYLCSDGHFTTEDGDYTFNTMEEKYVIFYFKNAGYVLKTDITKSMFEVCVFNGNPVIQIFNKNIQSFTVYGDEPFTTTFEIARFEGGLVGRIAYANLVNSGGYVANSCGNLTELSLPALATISGGTVAQSCGNLTELSLPALATISGGTVAYSCGKLTELSLPALATISGGTVANSCGKLTELSLPALATISGGTVAQSCGNLTELSLPALATISGGYVAQSCGNLKNVYLDSLETATFFQYDGFFRNIKNINQDQHVYIRNGKYIDYYLIHGTEGIPDKGFKVYFHLGANEDGYFRMRCYAQNEKAVVVTVENGFKSELRIDDIMGMTREQLVDILAKLADNTDGYVKSIIFGKTNLDKLTDEDIAIATSKNYSLS